MAFNFIPTMLIDTHCHIQFKAYKDDREEVLQRCAEKNLILNAVGTQLTTSKLAIKLAEQYDWVYASVGLHPIQEYVTKVEEESTSFLSRGEQFDYEAYKELTLHKKVIAIGETGLDRFHMPEGIDPELVIGKQREVFLQHAKLAAEVGKPLVVHVRDAHEDMIKILPLLGGVRGGSSQQDSLTSNNEPLPNPPLKGEGTFVPGVVHCFTGNWEQAQEYIKHGFYLGFTGVITYPPKKTNPGPQEWLNEVVEKIPLDRVVVETDAPYLAPQKYRGGRSEPWMVEEVVRRFAEVRELSFEEMTNITIKNSKKLFSLT